MDISKFIYRLNRAIIHYYYKFYMIPKRYDLISKQLSQIRIMNIKDTMNVLLKSNKSLSRFGDGELEWILGTHDKYSFEENSKLLSNKLLQVLNSHNKQLMITLPDGFHLNNLIVSRAAFFWKQYCTRYGKQILKLLNKDKTYYNTSVSRPYIDFNTSNIAVETFNMWKKFWNNKNILIVEGSESRLGVGDKLFNNAHKILRIECPPTNAFEHYNNILHDTLDFLNLHHNYITFISLGPTATVLSYDLCNRGFRAIDIGHIDLEYDWFLMGAKEKVDLPHKYVNELPNGRYALPVSNQKYDDEIIDVIK